MHEVSIVTELISTILEIADKNQLKKVSLVKIQIGKMRQIIPESFEFAFNTLKEKTIIANALLELSYEEVEIQCKECGYIEIIEANHFSCSRCHSPDIKIMKGRDIVLLSLEGEQNGD